LASLPWPVGADVSGRPGERNPGGEILLLQRVDAWRRMSDVVEVMLDQDGARGTQNTGPAACVQRRS
jgi:hypothetical protein